MNPLQELEHSLEASDLDLFDDDFNHITGGKDEIYTIMERPTRAIQRQASKPKISYILPD